MKADVYKVELLVIDHHGQLGAAGITSELENQKYFHSEVKGIALREVEWSDDHPLNKPATCDAEYERLFKNGK